MKKFLAVLLSLAMVLCLVACGSSELVPAETPSDLTTEVPVETPAESTTLVVEDYYAPGSTYPEVTDDLPEISFKVAHGNSDAQECHITLLRLKDLLEERTNGKFSINIYPNQQLGTDVETFQSMAMGDIEAVWQTTIIGTNYIVDDGLFDLSMYFMDMDQLNENLTGGDLRDYYQSVYRDNGVELLAMYCYGFRTLTSNTLIESVEDLKGMDIRTMPNPNHMAFWSAVGANPTALAWGEVYLSLQQGLLDSQENPMNAILTNNIGEVQKYVYNTNHIPFVGTIAMNQGFYESLPDEYKIILKVSIADAIQAALDMYDEDFDASLAALQDQGCTYIELSDETLKEMSEIGSVCWDAVFETLDPELVEICNRIFQ